MRAPSDIIARTSSPLLGASKRGAMTPFEVELPNLGDRDRVRKDHEALYLAFGGQGMTRDLIGELRSLNARYGTTLTDIISHCQEVLQSAQNQTKRSDSSRERIDLLQWLSEKESSHADMLSPSISIPLIGTIQICSYFALCTSIKMDPGQLNSMLAGVAGHSQGIITATFISASESWQSFYQCARSLLTILYHLGICVEQVWSPQINLRAVDLEDSVRAGQGMPLPMLSIIGLNRHSLERQIATVNGTVTAQHQIHIALRNSRTNFVVSGNAETLYALATHLRVSSELEQGGRIPFDKRPEAYSARFLPVAAPFHSPLLERAATLAKMAVQHIRLGKDRLVSIVASLEDADHDNVVPFLIDAVTSRYQDWCDTMREWSLPGQVIDLGPGSTESIGKLIHHVIQGAGFEIRRLKLHDNQPNLEEPSIGNTHRCTDVVEKGVNWHGAFGPQLHTDSTGRVTFRTKFVDLLGLPPLMIAGMTPTTSSSEYVGAIMRAGYHAELATGNFHNALALRGAITRLAEIIPEGRHITVNIVYASPQRVQWQLPLVFSLIEEGCPIGGITFGAGVPSSEIIANIIDQTRLSYISFKPGNVSAIHEVIKIAQQYPRFPFVLQWTGGRAGGHHSHEDFHQPILAMYSAIRACQNIVLVVGSGFGDAQGSWPYLSGQWSTASDDSGLSRMPFDAILIGTCAMTLLESNTSRSVKELIVNAAGVDDQDWTKSMERPTGGVITIVSEMGEPMHVLANRGMMLWAELDKTIFKLPRSQQLGALLAQRSYIIDRIDQDFQKVWFGHVAETDRPVNVSDMTYLQVLRRMLELMRPKGYDNWTHHSYSEIFDEFMLRTEERLGTAVVIDRTVDPFKQMTTLEQVLPLSSLQLTGLEDAEYFLDICNQPGRKPVPFIPVLDENFEGWFKKDSLWQSESIETTYHGDAGRVCILSGPVSVKHATKIDVPVSEYLGAILEEYISKAYENPDCIAKTLLRHMPPTLSSTASHGPDDWTYISKEVDQGSGDDKWLDSIGSHLGLQMQKALSARVSIRDGRIYDNPIIQVLSAARSCWSQYVNTCGSTSLQLYENGHRTQPDATLVYHNGAITLSLSPRLTIGDCPVELSLLFDLNVNRLVTPIRERAEGRNETLRNFYHSIWFGPGVPILRGSVGETFEFPETKMKAAQINHFLRAIDGFGEEWNRYTDWEDVMPLEYVVVVAWQALMQPLFLVDCDLSKLLHLAMSCKMLGPGVSILCFDSLVPKSTILEIANGEAGVRVVIQAVILKGAEPVIEIRSEFLFVGQSVPASSCYRQREQQQAVLIPLRTEADVAALNSKPWWRGHPSARTFTPGQQLWVHFDTSEPLDLHTQGEAYLESQHSEVEREFCGTLRVNGEKTNFDSIRSFLQRCKSSQDAAYPMQTPIDLPRNASGVSVTLPEDSDAYARVSRDFNPIHTSQTFARFAGLQGKICHGMHVNSLALHLIKKHILAGSGSRISAFQCNLLGKAFPGEEVSVGITHAATRAGERILNVTMTEIKSGVLIFQGTVTIEQCRTAALFTGQGSQFTAMGMELRSKHAVCSDVWAEADVYFETGWGKSLRLGSLGFSDAL